MANIEVYTVGEEDPYEPEDGNRVYGSEDDYNDFDEEDETYDESREYHSPEEQLEMQRQREYEITLKAYGDIFGLEQGKILADLVTQMSEMNLKGLVADHMEEYMELSNQFQAIMSSEDGLKKIAEYNARAVANMYSNED